MCWTSRARIRAGARHRADTNRDTNKRDTGSTSLDKEEDRGPVRELRWASLDPRTPNWKCRTAATSAYRIALTHRPLST